MQLPSAFLDSLTGTAGFNRVSFEKIHNTGLPITSIRFNPAKLAVENDHLPVDARIPWTEQGYYLSERPSFTFDPLFHAGCYYVQEASSMFLEQAMKQTVDLSQSLRVLDLCAAPGGKSTHIQSLISKDSLLVSNEVLRSRCNILKDNIIKWGSENVVVTNNDPSDFKRLEGYFDVIVVDAPCSGSGLFRKEPESVEQWSENNIMLCSQRQQRILADVLPTLKNGGILIYSTCSYSIQENEDIVDWLTKECSMNKIQLSISGNWGITASACGYRFWPDKVKGEGFFISILKKEDGETRMPGKTVSRLNKTSLANIDLLSNWYGTIGEKIFLQGFDGIYALDKKFEDAINQLFSYLRVAYFGTRLGEIMKKKLIPAHSLAMSTAVNNAVPRLLLNPEQAIRYLQKKELNVEKKQPGWQLVCFENHPLGWVNVLPGRVNNYYPVALRILKDN
jgi:16S rRNA C967 or C1407 C5-methylase (RsmB/RsmF family)/NOL1/NOP2/fmu family ribosome biogenesis protein